MNNCNIMKIAQQSKYQACCATCTASKYHVYVFINNNLTYFLIWSLHMFRCVIHVDCNNNNRHTDSNFNSTILIDIRLFIQMNINYLKSRNLFSWWNVLIQIQKEIADGVNASPRLTGLAPLKSYEHQLVENGEVWTRFAASDPKYRTLWVTFDFSDNIFFVTFLFLWHLRFNDIWVLVLFSFWWHMSFSEIWVLVTFAFW